MTIGSRIASLRKEHGFTQEALAEQMGVSRQAVAKWESGHSLPDIPTAITLSETFGVSLDYLVGKTDNTIDALCDRIKKISEESNRYEDVAEILGKTIQALRLTDLSDQEILNILTRLVNNEEA